MLDLFKDIKNGIFLEIGAWDGENMSQSAQLEYAGWTGICVDPFPKNFERRKCQRIKTAISKDGLPREFIKVTTDRRHTGDVSYFSGFKDAVKVHLPLIEEHCNYSIVTLPTVTFDMLPIPNRINFLSVDTEGSELEIFQSIDFNKYSFDVIMFEHNGIDTGIGTLLESKGYKLYHHSQQDSIYIL